MKKILSFILILFSFVNFVFAAISLDESTKTKLDASIEKEIFSNLSTKSTVDLKINYLTEKSKEFSQKASKYSSGTTGNLSYNYVVDKINFKINELKPRETSASSSSGIINVNDVITKILSDKVTYKDICNGNLIGTGLLNRNSSNIAYSFFKDLIKTDNQFMFVEFNPIKYNDNNYFLVYNEESNSPKLNIIKLSCKDYTFETVHKIDLKEKSSQYKLISNENNEMFISIYDKDFYSFNLDSLKLTKTTDQSKIIPVNTGTINVVKNSGENISGTGAQSQINSNTGSSMSSMILDSILTKKNNSIYQIQGVLNSKLKVDYVEVLSCNGNYSKKYDKNWFRLKLFKMGDKLFNINVAEKYSNMCDIPYKIRIIQGGEIFEMSYKIEK